MPRADVPANPLDELRRNQVWRSQSGGLAADVVAFCSCGLSIAIATADPSRQPIAGIALGCRVERSGAVRILMGRSGNERLLQALAAGAPMAVTFSQPTTHRSIQLKAPRTEIVQLQPEDEVELARQTANMSRELVDVGYSEDFGASYTRYARDDFVALKMEPEAAFVQTPGPGAGSALP